MKYLFFLLLVTCCTNQKTKSDNNTETITENISIQVSPDTGNYITTVTENFNPEGGHVVVLQYNVLIINEDNENSVTVTDYRIIENPFEGTAEYSIDYEGCPNGLYYEQNSEVNFPITINPGEKLSLIMKHGQIIDQKALDFIKFWFDDYY